MESGGLEAVPDDARRVRDGSKDPLEAAGGRPPRLDGRFIY